MANHKNAEKAIRQNTKRRLQNRLKAKTTRNAIKNLKLAESAAATESLPKVISMIDKLAKKNIIHKNKASNLKRQLMKKVSANS